MAVGGDLAWYSEIEPAACTVLAAHYPDVPNLGDITAVDWSAVEPVDVITGGYPCQPFSHAGKRKGTKDERHLWPYVRDAISALRPSLAVLENVRGHLSLGLADVIGDLAGLGYDARWGVVRASDAGAPHGRARVFITAYPTCGIRGTRSGRGVPESEGATRLAARAGISADAVGTRLQRASDLRRINDEPDGTASISVISQTGVTTYADDPGNALGSEPRDAQHGSPESFSHADAKTIWGQYAPAVNRWEPIVGRFAPSPTVQRKDKQRLNPVFVEWMMGLPEGHVTGHGLSAAQELKMLGNGVVPQQAALALRLLGVR
jgi:DNA (cytosine-5)-methyltransferase 1